MTHPQQTTREVIEQLVEALDHCMAAITERGLNGSPDQAEKWGLQLPLVRAESAITAAQSMLANPTPQHGGEAEPEWTDENVIAYCIARGISAAKAFTTGATQPQATEPAPSTDICQNCAGQGWEPSVNYGKVPCSFCQPAPSTAGEREALPMDTAPTDGTMIRLLVDFEGNSLEDTDQPVWTIGACYASDSEGDVWQFAGWNWSHDHFTEGHGKPIGWLPMLDAALLSAPALPAATMPVGELTAWIATKDQYPPEGVRVFWLDENSNRVGYDTWAGGDYIWSPTHWMHIPATAAARSQPTTEESSVVAVAQPAREPMIDGKELWLWQNGDHMLAFEHLYPCFAPGGDPMTLGKPFGKAVFRVSHDRSNGITQGGKV